MNCLNDWELVGDDLFVKMNEEKVVEWMVAKSNSIVNQIMNNEELKSKVIVRKRKDQSNQDEQKIRLESIRFLSEYMDKKWIEMLSKHFE